MKQEPERTPLGRRLRACVRAALAPLLVMDELVDGEAPELYVAPPEALDATVRARLYAAGFEVREVPPGDGAPYARLCVARGASDLPCPLCKGVGERRASPSGPLRKCHGCKGHPTL